MFLAIIGALTLVIVALKVALFVYQHFFLTTNFKVYGANKEAGDRAWAVVTGASEGVGKGFAYALGQKGFNVVIISRRVESLNPIAEEIKSKYNVDAKVLAVDCSDKDAVSKIVSGVKDLNVSVLVNNVGLNTKFPENLIDTPEDEIETMINVNCLFTTKLTREFVSKIFSKRQNKDRSLIFNISSYTGRVPVAMMSVYSATKSYVDVFSRALSAELKSSRIDVSSVLPHYVVSVMSGIRKSSWAIPEAIPFAHSTLNQVSCGSYSIAPHWFHDITTIGSNLLPDSVVGPMTLSKMIHVRKALKKREEREAEAKKQGGDKKSQ